MAPVIPVVGDKNLVNTVRFTGIDYTVRNSTEILDSVNYSATANLRWAF